MKKIFAILLSLLFLVSVFGVASVMAPQPPPCECHIAGPEPVHVGETFQVVLITTGPYRDPAASPITKLIDVETTSDGYILTYKALAPGTILVSCCGGRVIPGSGGLRYEYYVTIVPKEYPMLKFKKILGFGQED